VSSETQKSDTTDRNRTREQGLFRTILAGSGHTLAEAFANLERAPNVERLWRHGSKDLLGARIALTAEEGEGYWDLTRIRNDLYVIVENFAYKNPRIEFVPGDGLVQFNFKVSGDMTLAVTRTEPLRFNRPSLLVWSQPMGLDIDEWTAPSAHERNVAISIRPEFLLEYFLNSASNVPEQLQVFVSDRPEKINYCQIPLSAQMFDAVTRLINNPYTGSLALVYTEAVSLELMCSALGSFRTLSATPSEEYSDRELRCLHAARGILMRQFAPPPAIRHLARSVGIAETTLRRGFKAVFGDTVFNFGLRCRMQHALALLRDQHWSVARAAEAIGYAHCTSFTTAFRRHFGMRPIDVRRVKRR
jgi:AraC-like DNA-binding protein